MDELKPIRRGKYSFWPFLILLAVILAVLGSSCTYDFSWWDDWSNIQLNPQMNPPTLGSVAYYLLHPSLGLYVPVTYWVWLAVASVARLNEADEFGVRFNPWFFHSANLIIHIVTSWFVYVLLYRLTRRNAPALVAALFWAIHPVQVEAVCWVSGTKDLLAGCFEMAVLCRYVARAQMVQSGQAKSMLDIRTAILLILALLSKPSAMMTPLVMFTLDWLIIVRPLPRVLRTTCWWLLLVLPFAIIARLAQTIPVENHIAPIWIRPFIFSDAIAFYLSKVLLPIRLCLDYGRRWWVIDQRPSFYASMLVPIVGAAIVYFARRKLPWLMAGALIFTLSLLPVSGLTSFEFEQTSTTADHYLYVAMLGPALIVAFLLTRLQSRKTIVRFGYAAAVVILSLLAIQSVRQKQTWQSDFTLFSHALAINPNSGMAHNNLACGYSMRNDLPNAIREYRTAIRVDGEYYLAYSNLKDRLLQMHDVDGAIAVMQDYMRVYSRVHGTDDLPVHLDIARLEISFGRNAQAIEECRHVLRAEPSNAEALAALADAQQGIAATQSTSQPSQ